MKNKYRVSIYFLSFFSQILTARPAQGANMFDAAIQQIDTQSKELNQQVISGQQEGLASQKIQRLELELTNIKAEHTKELETLKAGYEDQIKTLKTQVVNDKDAHTSQATALAVAKKDLEDAHQEIAQLKTEADDLKAKVVLLEEQLKEYNTLKSHMAEAQEKMNALIPAAHEAATKTE